jgi:hypothetical protein
MIFRCMVLAILGAAVSGCLSSDEQAKANMNTWIGAPISAYALQHGLPQSSFDLGAGRKDGYQLNNCSI